MFGQVIQGSTADPASVREAMDRWVHDLSPGAEGWLWTTAGVTQDGRFVAVVRFDSEGAARASADRPEHDRWWAETSRLLDGDVTVMDGTVAYTHMTGDPARAGFVQVVQGRTSDRQRFRELLRAEEPFFSCRPDCLGQTVIEHDESAWTLALYGTTEDEVRAGELTSMPAEWQSVFLEQQQLMIGEPVFFDLPQPWLFAAPGFRPPGPLGPGAVTTRRE